jgi:hypothetical protein
VASYGSLGLERVHRTNEVRRQPRRAVTTPARSRRVKEGWSFVRGSAFRRCSCRSPDGKQLGAGCPELGNRRHGEWYIQTRLETTEGRRLLKRAVGSAKRTSKADAEKVLEQVNDLLRLADDLPTRVRIGDLIQGATRRGGPLPQVQDLRRRLGLTGDLTGTETAGELFEAWFTSKRARWRPSTVKAYREKLDQHILPVIKDIPAERLNEMHIAAVFTRIEERNAEILATREAGEKTFARVVGVSTQHHILGVVRAALNWGVRQRKIRFNPALGLDLEPRTRQPAWCTTRSRYARSSSMRTPRATGSRCCTASSSSVVCVAARWSGSAGPGST